MNTPLARIPAGPWVRIHPWMTGAAWQLGPICVVSTLDRAKLPRGEGSGPQWHISVTRYRNKRPNDDHVRRALRDFHMVGAEEDNHHPGNARHFFLVCNPADRVTCECKEDEVTVVEPDGYTWQNDPNDCRGCEWERRWGKPCAIHQGAP